MYLSKLVKLEISVVRPSKRVTVKNILSILLAYVKEEVRISLVYALLINQENNEELKKT